MPSRFLWGVDTPLVQAIYLGGMLVGVTTNIAALNYYLWIHVRFKIKTVD